MGRGQRKWKIIGKSWHIHGREKITKKYTTFKGGQANSHPAQKGGEWAVGTDRPFGELLQSLCGVVTCPRLLGTLEPAPADGSRRKSVPYKVGLEWLTCQATNPRGFSKVGELGHFFYTKKHFGYFWTGQDGRTEAETNKKYKANLVSQKKMQNNTQNIRKHKKSDFMHFVGFK